eukprot:COSAG06_NODE_10455_length_1679_cov_1.374051_1_plen_93_part_00
MDHPTPCKRARLHGVASSLTLHSTLLAQGAVPISGKAGSCVINFTSIWYEYQLKSHPYTVHITRATHRLSCALAVLAGRLPADCRWPAWLAV